MNARDHDKRPEQIENEIEHTRAEVSATIDAIQSKLTPGQLMDQTLGYLRSSLPAEFGSNLSRSVRDNPIPVALLGIGLAWLMMGGQQNGRMRRYAQDVDSDLDVAGGQRETGDAPGAHTAAAGERLRQRTAELSGRAREAADSMRERLGATTDSARARLDDIGQRSREGYQRARGQIDHVIEEQPLVLGAVGLAVGAVLGASLPRTRQEDEWLGGTRDRVLDGARQAAREQVDAVKQASGQAPRPAPQTPGNGHDQSEGTHAEQHATSGQLSIGHMNAP